MVADPQHQVLHIAYEEIVVVGDWAVPRVRQPEVLPDDHPMPVAGFPEGVVADLPDPVANHREVHLAVIADRGVIFAGAIAEHRLAKSPVAATSDEASAIDEDPQHPAIFAISKLANACFEGLLVEHLLVSG